MPKDIVRVLNEGDMIKNRYVVEKKLGEGGYGAVYRVRHINTNELYAMKVEGCTESNHHSQVIKMEVLVLKEINNRGGRHACKIATRGRTSTINYVIMTLLGQSLSDLRKAMPDRHFSLGTALCTGIQCLEAVEDLHRIGYIHRDIKPCNFAIGREEKDEHRTIFILDFGLARSFVDKNGEMRTPRATAGFRGTVRYAPLSSHNSRELSRKDDLETWFYLLVEITLGRLPWSNIVSDRTKVAQMKKDSREDKTLYNGCPKKYEHILTYIDSLKYWHLPDYNSIYGHLRQSMHLIGCKESDPYDWEKEKKAGSRRFLPRIDLDH